MKKFLFLAMFLLTTCSVENHKVIPKFSDDISFEEFKEKLKEYSNNSPFPNIDD